MTTLVQVRGRYQTAQGLPARGAVTFTPTAAMQDAAGNVVVAAVSVTAQLDASGAFAVDLAATDDLTLTPTGVTYEVTELLQGAVRSYPIEVPASASVGGLDLADIAPAVPGPPQYTYALATTVSALTDRVSAVETGSATVVALTAETDARTAADSGLDGRLVAVEGALPVKADLVGGTVPDAQIPAGVTRDTELAAGLAEKLSTTDAAATYAARAQNLLDLASIPTARANLGLGSAAVESAAALRDRATHTGTQPVATVTGLQTALDAKAPSVAPTLTAVTPETVLGPELQPAMSSWTLTGGAAYAAGPPEQVTTGAGAGSLSFPVTVMAGQIVQVDLLGTFSGGVDYTVALGSDTKTHTWWWGNRSLTFVAAASGTATVTVSWLALTATLSGVRVRQVSALRTRAAQAGSTEVRASGTNNALGQDAQRSLTTGNYNNAVGHTAQYSLTTGNSNNAVGHIAQYSLTTGSYNNAVGHAAQYSLTTGSYNNAVGHAAQYSLTTGNYNNALGHAAQYSPLGSTANATTTGNRQTSVGHETGQSSAVQVDDITTIGYRATAGATKATSLGSGARADHAASVALGSDTLTTAVDQVMVGVRDIEITGNGVKGLVMRSANGTRYRITVADAGAVTATAAP